MISMLLKTKFLYLSGWLLLVCGFMACTPQPVTSPTAISESRLTPGYMPKVLVTVEITPTLNPTFAAATVTATAHSEEVALIAPTATQTMTLTPYVGVFLGGPTSDSPAVIPTGAAAVAVLPSQERTTACTLPIADIFASAYASNPSLQAFGCPQDSGLSVSLVMQRFESGRMFWRDTRQILILADSGIFWRTADSWQEGFPADDPALTPPEGRLQPVRGFGLVWRNNPTFRDSLGWALGPEFPIASQWQEFEAGTLFLGDSGLIYALPRGETGQYLGNIAP